MAIKVPYESEWMFAACIANNKKKKRMNERLNHLRIGVGGKQVFRQYDKFNSDTFTEYLKIIYHKFPKCYLFMDKTSPHYKSEQVKEYLGKNNETLILIYLPTASPEFMMLEEFWNID